MRYVKYTDVDATTGIPLTQAVSQTGPIAPDIPGLLFGFSLDSQNPVAVPTHFGTTESEDVLLSIPGFLGELTQAEYDAAKVEEMQARADKAEALLIGSYESTAQGVMDSAARAAGYDSLATAISYADEDAVPKFQEDGKAFRRWRSLVWAYAYDILEKVKAGEMEPPPLDEFLAEMPQLGVSRA